MDADPDKRFTIRVAVVLAVLLSGIATASAQSLSPPLVDIPSSSLVPPEQPIVSLPPAASNLLAPTSSSEAPPDQLGANLYSTASSPAVSGAFADRPAAEIDTVVRGTQQLGPNALGSLSPRSVYGSTQAARWSGSGTTARMMGAPSAGVHATSQVSWWGIPATPGADTTVATPRLRAVAKLDRNKAGVAYSSVSQAGNSTFGFHPGIPESESNFGESSFGNLDSAQGNFLNTDLSAPLTFPTFRRLKSGTSRTNKEMQRLQTQMYPHGYVSSFAKKPDNKRVTMKSLIEKENQPDSNAPLLFPWLLTSQ